MGNCGSAINCAQCYGEEEGCLREIKVDPDIAGIGVLIAFFLAAAFTCAAVLYGYFTDSLPETLLSDVDKAVIERFQTSFIGQHLLPSLGSCWFRSKSLFYRCIGGELPQQRAPIPRDQRVAAVTRFILAHSDQQLVTGIALFTAALVNRCQLTRYELRIINALGWFSATTHVVTLKVLREYMYANTVVRNWRIIGVFTFLVLLLFFRVVDILGGQAKGVNGTINQATPIQCIMDGRIQYKIGSATIARHVLLLGYFLVPIYLNHTIALCLDPRNVPSFLIWYRVLSRRHGRIVQDEERIYYDAHLRREVYYTGAYWIKSFRLYRYSFLSYLPMIAFSMVYGVLNTAFLIWYKSPRSNNEDGRMGFGQVVAVALLAIPFLTASEVYNEARNTGVEKQSQCDIADNTVNQYPTIINASHERRPHMSDKDVLREFYWSIDRDDRQYALGHALTPKQIARISITLLEYRAQHQKVNAMWRKIIDFDEKAMRPILFVLFFYHLFTQLFGAAAVTVPTPLPDTVWRNGLLWYGSWMIIVMIIDFLDIFWLRRLGNIRYTARRRMPTSRQGWDDLFDQIFLPTGPARRHRTESWNPLFDHLLSPSEPQSRHSLEDDESDNGGFETDRDEEASLGPESDSLRHLYTPLGAEVEMESLSRGDNNV